ncbi:MAG: DsbA family protein [Hyphomicrobiales bacterium]|nr:DsbA family protein [Hyphomicrobiales bacterium]
MTEFQTPPHMMITRRGALKGSIGLVTAAAGVAAYFSPLPGMGIHGAAAAPSESELMADGPLPENALGEATAPNTVIEYSSMTCPHCASFHKTIVPELKSKYVETGQVRYILREFPLNRMAFAASMLARCAGPEKFFPFVKVLYEKQEVWAFGEGDPVERLFTMAKQAGFTRESFETCLKDQKLLDGITAVRKRASEKFGVNSTPTLFVNGQILKGARDISDLEKLMKLEKKS